VLLALLAGPAWAQSSSLDVRSLPEWFGAPGQPGQVDDVHMGNGLPWTWLGLAAGGVALRDGLLPGTAPWPGLEEIAVPRAWYDSTAVVVGADAGWRGFSAALVELRAIATPPRVRRPRAAFTLVNGSSAMDRNGLVLQRGGETSWLRGGALADDRAGAGLLERRGAHVWFAEVGLRRQRQTFSGAFSQRGLAGSTRPDARFVDLDFGFRPPFIGFEEAARGESGEFRWRLGGDDRHLAARLARSRDHRESFEPLLEDLFAEREAQQNTVELEAVAGQGERVHALRLELGEGRVARSVDFLAGAPARVWRQRTVWAAARDVRPFAGGTLELQLGGGWTDAPARKAERGQLAPSVVWGREADRFRWRVHGGRFVTPLWSDLAPGQSAFVPDAWAAGASAGFGRRDRAWLDVGGLFAETGQRALLARQPVRDISLRLGWVAEPVRVQDAQLTVAAGLRGGPFGVDGSFFSRVRPAGAQVARVDAAQGARGGVEVRFRAFAGDLGVRLRGEAAWVGERDTEPLVGYFTRPVPLPGYATFDASLALELGDARIVVRAENLEDVAHPQVWTDPSSPFPGTPAVGSARQFRLELSWPFFN